MKNRFLSPISALLAFTLWAPHAAFALDAFWIQSRCLSEDGSIRMLHTRSRGVEGVLFVPGDGAEIYASPNKPDRNWPNRPVVHGLRYSAEERVNDTFDYVTRFVFTSPTPELKSLIDQGKFNQNFNCTHRQYDPRGLE